MRVEYNAENGMSGMDKFGSVIDRMNRKLGSKFLNSIFRLLMPKFGPFSC
jgi:hypothetical protein